MAKDYAALARAAADMTNKQLASDLTDLSALTRKNLADLLPSKDDKKGFTDLMAIVQKETNDDVAAARLVDDSRRLIRVAVKALRFFL